MDLNPFHAVLCKEPQDFPVVLVLRMDAAERYQPRLPRVPVGLYGGPVDVPLLPCSGHYRQQHGIVHPRLPHGSAERTGRPVQMVPGPGTGGQFSDGPPRQLLRKCMCVEIYNHISPPFSPASRHAGFTGSDNAMQHLCPSVRPPAHIPLACSDCGPGIPAPQNPPGAYLHLPFGPRPGLRSTPSAPVRCQSPFPQQCPQASCRHCWCSCSRLLF